MSDLHDSIARLTPDQRTQLEARLRERRPDAVRQSTIELRSNQAQWPMSAGQLRIWSLSRLRPDDPVYNMQQAWRLHGRIDPVVLEASIGEIIRRHEVLRARFSDDGGVPVQDIRPFDGFELPVERPSDRDGSDPLEHAEAVAKAEAERGFDLVHDLLIRCRLLVVAEDDHVLVLTVHHLVCDGWSMDIIERELSAVYADLLGGGESSLKPLPFQYADFAEWQEERRRGPAGQRDFDYWARRLESPVTSLEIPQSKARSDRGALEGGHLEITFESKLTTAVKAFSRDNKVTPFTTLLTAYQLALHRATGQEDIVLCSPAAGRIHLKSERLIGYFNNLVVLRGDLSGDPTVRRLLGRNRTVVLEAFDHQGAAFQDVAALPGVATVPLARGLFVLQETPLTSLQLPGVSVAPFVVEAETADFELAVFVREIGGRFRSVIRFRRNVVTSEDVEALMKRFESTLRDMIEWPDRNLSQLVPAEPMAPDGSKTMAEPTTRGIARTEARPRTLLESQLLAIWERLFNRSPISIHEDFFDLGGHSLLAAEMIAEIEQHILGEPMPLATLFRAPTIAELADVIAAGGWSESWASLVPIQPKGSRPPLFFVHAHGGNVIGYRDLAKRLGDDQPFYGLQAPEINLSGAEIVPRRIEDMAAQYIEEVRTAQRHGPYLLGGWCLGGDVAFEMAGQLSAAGEDVAMLVMVDNPRPEFLATQLKAPALVRVWNRVRTRLRMEWANFLEVPWSGRPRFVWERLSRLARRGFVAVEMLISQWIRMPHSRAYRRERIAIAYEKAYEAYHPKTFAGPITVVRAEQQPLGRGADPTLGWERYVEGEIQVIEAPGHRIGLLSEPRVGVVAEQIRQVLAQGLNKVETSEP